MTNIDCMIEPAELAALLDKEPGSVKLLDATYPAQPARKRIGNALPFDIDEVADPASPMPHMLPAPEDFAAAVEKRGISSGDLVVVYDRAGIAMAAARAWWMFRAFGHDNVRVLNGGMPAWIAEGHPVNEGAPPQPQRGRFKAVFRPTLVRSMGDVHAVVEAGGATIIDARPAERFSGQAPEPRPGMRAGHIPGRCNVPFGLLIDPRTKKLKSAGDLQSVFAKQGGAENIISSCGSGVTACVLALGLFRIGKTGVAVYDGSWAEWGNEVLDMPISLEH